MQKKLIFLCLMLIACVSIAAISMAAGPCGNSPCTCKDPEMIQDHEMSNIDLHALTQLRMNCMCAGCKKQITVAKCDCAACKDLQMQVASTHHKPCACALCKDMQHLTSNTHEKPCACMMCKDQQHNKLSHHVRAHSTLALAKNSCCE